MEPHAAADDLAALAAGAWIDRHDSLGDWRRMLTLPSRPQIGRNGRQKSRRPHLVDLTPAHQEIVPTPTDWIVRVVAAVKVTMNVRVVFVAIVIVPVRVTPVPATSVVVPPLVLVIIST